MGATKDADHSADTIEFLQKRMLEFAERFRLLAESWRGDQFGVLKVTRDPQRVRGIENLKNFASAVEKALDDERERSYCRCRQNDRPIKNPGDFHRRG